MIDYDSTPDSLQNLSVQDFVAFGMQNVAYIRPVHIEGKARFAVHAADGTPLSVVDSFAEAEHLIHHNDLESAVLH